MTNQRLTQCPHCKASFKVSEEQISAANGRVRCGACMNIFDAVAYSISKVGTKKTQTTASQDTPKPPSSDSPPVELEESILNNEDLFADNPEEDQEEAGYSGSPKVTDSFNTVFLELDDRRENTQDPYSTSFSSLDEEPSIDQATPKDPIDESWTQNILNDMESETADKIEPHISNTETPNQASQNHNAFMTDMPEPPDTLPDSSTQHDQMNYEHANFNFQQDSDPNQRHWFMSVIFALFNTALVIVLLAQVSWYHYEKLAKYPAISSIYLLACEKLSCTLPKLEDISKIKSHNLIVRSHPTTRKALIIDTVMINEASYGQAFPDIALYFSDINKQVIAQRLIHPDEYRAGELLDWPKMPTMQPIHISLEIIDPGKEAVNYTLEFFPPKTTTRPNAISET